MPRTGSLVDAVAENRARYESQADDLFEDMYGAADAPQRAYQKGMPTPFEPETGLFQGVLGNLAYYTNRGRAAGLDYIDTLIGQAKLGKWPGAGQLGQVSPAGEETLAKLLTTQGLGRQAARAVGRGAPLRTPSLAKESGLGRLYADVDISRTSDPVRLRETGQPLPGNVLEKFWVGTTDAERAVSQQQVWHAMGADEARAAWVFKNVNPSGRQTIEREAQIYYIAYNRMEAAQDLLKKVLGNRLGIERRTGASHELLTPLWQSSPPTGVPKTGSSMLVDARAKLWGHKKDIEKGRKVDPRDAGFLAAGTRKQRQVFLEKLTEWSSLLTAFAATIGGAGALAAEGSPPDAPRT
jgi:hypothetical protein